MEHASRTQKASRVFEIIVILFVIVGMVLTLAEIRKNINAEWARQQQVEYALDPEHLDPTLTPTPRGSPTAPPTATPVLKAGPAG